MSKITKLFQDLELKTKIRGKLPKLFQLAELDNSRDGKLGMEVGSARERIIIALLISQFGTDHVDPNLPITNKEVDVIVFDQPISIKTVTSKNIVGVKLIWTVDPEKAQAFITSYQVKSDMLFIHINWNGEGGFYLIPKEVQTEVLTQFGSEFYFKLPKPGTNPRGVEITNQAMHELVTHKQTRMIDISWFRSEHPKYTPYDRWIAFWNNEKDNII